MIEIYEKKENVNTNPELPRINKVIDDDMNQLRDAVLNGVYYDSVNNKLVNCGGAEIKPVTILSTEEFFTGFIWRNRKKVYGKIFNGTKNGPLTFDISDLNIELVVPPTHGTLHVQENADNQFRGISSYGSSANYVSYEVQLNTGLLSIEGANGAYSQGEVEFLLFYTKTTDEPIPIGG